MRCHWVQSPYCAWAIDSSVSPDWTSYVVPAASTVGGTDVAAAETVAADADGTGEASGGRTGRATGAAATVAAAGTPVGVGAAAPPPHPTPMPRTSTAPAARSAPRRAMRRELRVRRTFPSPGVHAEWQYIQATRRTGSPLAAQSRQLDIIVA